MKKVTMCAIGAVAVLAAGSVWAGSLNIPNTFTSGSQAKAAEVNANFDEVKISVDDNDTRITANANAIAGKQDKVIGTCNVGSAIRSINSNGTVICDSPSATYTYFSGLNKLSGTASTTFTKLEDIGTFYKASANTKVELRFNSPLSAAGANVLFQLRIDDAIPTYGNGITMQLANAGTVHSFDEVFSYLAAGSHTLSIWVRTSSGTASSVIVDPGGWGGHVMLKQTP